MPRPSPLCTSQRATESAKSPLPSSPSTCPSSPSSAPSSPSSLGSTSPGRMGTGYHEDVDGNTRVTKAGGDGVSSTSSSLAPSLLSAPPSASFHCLSLIYDNGQKEGVDTDIYDPFQPTEGEGLPGIATGDEEDKYDPFEPTGSPASEKEMDGEQDEEEESSISNIKDYKEEEDLDVAPEVEGSPPDSTERLGRVLVSEDTPMQVTTIKNSRQRGKDRRDYDDSEHSEIEEGEIVGMSESRREMEIEIKREVLLPSPGSPSFMQGGGLKPERILRVLDGEGFVSVRAEAEWDHQLVPPIGMGDLRRKLTNRRKQIFRSCPSSVSMSPPPASVLPVMSPSLPASQPPTTEKPRSHKSSKSSKERDHHKSKGQEKEKRKKRKEEKRELERACGVNKEREQERRSRREGKEKDRKRRSRSYNQAKKSIHHSAPDPASRSHNTSRYTQSHRSLSNPSEGHHRGRDRDRDQNRERDRYRERRRDSRQREREKDSRMREGRKRDRDEGSRRSSSRERGDAKRRRESTDRRDKEKERGHERDRDRRRDGRPVVPPSIQDLNGSDLFAIKRTITVTTTPTTNLILTSPSHTQARSPTQGSDKPRKRKRKRRRRCGEEEAEHRSRSPPTSLSPLQYHGYESDRLSDHPEPDMLSLDGEALDSDYPSLEDSPLLPPPPEPPLPSPKLKCTAMKSSRHHQRKKSRSRSKKLGQSESSTSSSTHRPKLSKSKTLLPSLSPPISASSGNTASLHLTASSSSSSAKRVQKTGKDKPSKKESARSVRSKKLGGCNRKSKLQSKVSVLVREGVSSTTGNSAKLGIDLLGPSGTAGPSVVGGSIAVVFRRDNESRSPFLKPCSEPLSLPGRVKDLNKTGKQRNTLSSLSSTTSTGLKSKKAKPSSTTSTSSSASSPTSSSAAKRRRRPGKKPREKGLTVDGANGKGNNGNALESGYTVALDIQPLSGIGPKPSSPPSTHPGPTPSSSSSSSSSSTSVLPPSSSPPHTPPLSLPPSRDTRESSPDSQTVDSSCKTPEPSFLSEEISAQSQSTMLVPAKSPPSLPPSRNDGLSQSVSMLLPLDDHKLSPPCSTSSTAMAAASLSHSIPLLAAEPSSSSSASVSSSTVSKPPPPPPPPATVPPLPWSLQTGVDCTAGGVLALTALLFKMEEANMASRAKAQEFIQATSQILSQANQNQSHSTSSTSTSQAPPPPPSHAPPPGPTPTQFILHGSLPLVSCTKTPPSHLHPGLSLGGGCAQTPPPPLPMGLTGTAGGASETSWDVDSKDPDKYLKKLHTQERAVEEVKLAIKPYYQRKDINKDEYKDILRKAVHKICHSRTGEINPVKVSNLVKLYVQRYKYFRKHGRKMDDEDKDDRDSASLHGST